MRETKIQTESEQQIIAKRVKNRQGGEIINSELVALREADKDTTALPSDMYGVTLLVIVLDLSEFCACKMTLPSAIRFGLCSTAIVLNIALQMGVLYFVKGLVVDGSVHNVQENYKSYHAEVFGIEGNFRSDVWNNWNGPWMDLCSSALSKPEFSYAITLLWVCRMFGEFRDCLRIVRNIWVLPNLPGGTALGDMVYEVRDSHTEEVNEIHIIALTHMTRLFIVVFVTIPKLVVCFILCFVGMRWLSATESVGNLILNALSLEFVVGIDELIYEVFLPELLHDNMAIARLALPREAGLTAEQETEKEETKKYHSYATVTFFFAACIIMTALYVYNLQQVLPGYLHDIHQHCGKRFWDMYTPVCSDFEDTCFPYGPPLRGPFIQTFYIDNQCKDEIGITQNWTIAEGSLTNVEGACLQVKMSTQSTMRYRKFECMSTVGNKTMALNEYTEGCQGTPISTSDVSAVWTDIHHGLCYPTGDMYALFKGGVPTKLMPECNPQSATAYVAGSVQPA